MASTLGAKGAAGATQRMLSDAQSSTLFNTSATQRWAVDRGSMIGANLGGWLLIEPWMFDQDWAWHDSELDVVQALRRQHCQRPRWQATCAEGDAFAIQTMRNHWGGYISDASLDALRAYGATHVRIPVGYWIMDAPVGSSDPYEFGFQAEGFVTGGLNYLEAMLLRLKRRGLRAMIDLHALPGCASACEAYAGVMCRTPTFWRARPCLAPRGRTSILQRLLRRLSVPRRAVRCAGARRLERACCAAMEARMRRWPARRAAQAQASCG